MSKSIRDLLAEHLKWDYEKMDSAIDGVLQRIDKMNQPELTYELKSFLKEAKRRDFN